MRHPISFHAEMMGDIMYSNQAMKQHDYEDFVKAVVKEVDGHVKAKHWKVLKQSLVANNSSLDLPLTTGTLLWMRQACLTA